MRLFIFYTMSIDCNRNKHAYYTSKDYIKKTFLKFKRTCNKITNFERFKILPLPEKENKFCYKNKKFVIYVKIHKNTFYSDIKTYRKARNHDHHTGKYRSVESKI